MIQVLAGVNGAGKSSILGEGFRRAGGEYFNPDEVARAIQKGDESLSLADANGLAWERGFKLLNDAIDEDKNYTFETTLGGNSVCKALHRAVDNGIRVEIWFCGLKSPELHIERVAARVAKGGHDIPEHKIRERWTGSLTNMISLIPRVYMVKVFDNSAPLRDGKPDPVQIFHLENNELVAHPTAETPRWAKPLAHEAILAAAR